MNDVTQILSQITSGNAQATERLLPLVYDELRKLAAQEMRAKNRARHCSPLRWCTRLTCVLSMASNPDNGRAAAISLPRRQKP